MTTATSECGKAWAKTTEEGFNFPMLGVLKSRLSNSRDSQANGHCEGNGDDIDQKDGWNKERWQGERSEGAI